MSHGIMICDVPLYRDLTKVNVHAYLASKLVWVDTLTKLELLLSLDQTYEFIITLSTLNNVDVAERVFALRNKFLPRAPFIIIGHHELKNANIGTLQSAFDQTGIIKYIIKQLKWTPTEYNNRKIDDFIPIPLSLIQYTTHAVEDLYLLRPDNHLNEFILAATKDEELHDLLKNWIKLEISNVYVSKEKRLAAAASITKFAIDATSLAINSADESLKQKTLSTNTAYFAEIFNDPEQFDNIANHVKEQIGVLAQKTNVLIAKVLNGLSTSTNPTLSALINSFRSHEQSYLPQLSFLSMYISLQMMKHESWYSDAVEEKVRYIHFFNNLVLTNLYKKHPTFPKDKNIFYHYAQLNEKEKDLFRWHPRICSNLISTIPGLPVGLDQLILQHHGNTNGDLHNLVVNEDLSLIAKYCFIAELFAEYVLDLDLPMTQENKNEIIQKLRNKITLRSYVKVINLLEKIVI